MKDILKKTKKKYANIKIVSKASGWNMLKANKMMKQAQELGLSNREYIQNKAWELSSEKIEALAKKLCRQKEKKAEHIKNVCQRTGWSTKKAKNHMQKAEKLGVSFFQYDDKYCHDLSEDEIREFGEILKKQKEMQKKDQKFYLDLTCKRTGWDAQKAKKEMDAAKKQGISYQKYIQKGCWEKAADERDFVLSGIKKDSQRLGNKREEVLQDICDKMGWSRGKAELEINRAKTICRVSYSEYREYKFYEIPPEEQKNYVSYGLFSKMLMKYNDPNKARIFADKGGFNEKFHDMIHHRWFVNENLTYEEFKEKIKGLKSLIVKPIASTQGKGVQKFSCNISEEENQKLYQTLMKLGRSIIEEYIIQHEEMMKFCDTSVNTIRITTLNYHGECRFLYAVFRMGRGSVVDNFHAGGIAAGVNVETGIVDTEAGDTEGNTYAANPYSGRTIPGFQIPHWDRIIEACQKIYDRIEDVNLIGWDFAITKDGAELIEGNPLVSHTLGQVPYVKERKGLRDRMVDPYLEEYC
jgi:hypothetical protein